MDDRGICKRIDEMLMDCAEAIDFKMYSAKEYMKVLEPLIKSFDAYGSLTLEQQVSLAEMHREFGFVPPSKE